MNIFVSHCISIHLASTQNYINGKEYRQHITRENDKYPYKKYFEVQRVKDTTTGEVRKSASNLANWKRRKPRPGRKSTASCDVKFRHSRRKSSGISPRSGPRKSAGVLKAADRQRNRLSGSAAEIAVPRARRVLRLASRVINGCTINVINIPLMPRARCVSVSPPYCLAAARIGARRTDGPRIRR